MKKSIVFITLLSLLVLAGCINKTSQPTNAPADNEVAEEKPIGGDQDERGCLGPAGYSWCEAKLKCLRVFEEFCPDAVATIVSYLKNETGVELTLVGDKEFNWIAREGDVTTDVKITGVAYEADNVLMADYLKIEKYMNDNFETDSYNLADGVVGGLRGYYANYMVCDLNFRHNQMKENESGISESDGDSLKVTLDCGYFNKNDIHSLITAQIIKEILAKKYQKAISEVTVKVNKSAENHAVGSVRFGPEGTPGGLWFAAKTDSGWELVYDGNGIIPCDAINKYDFPEDMVPQCIDTQNNNELIVR